MEEEEKKKLKHEISEAVGNDNVDDIGWTRGPWRRFMAAFGIGFFVVNAFLWIGLVNQEVQIRRTYEQAFISIDLEWFYLQKITRLMRVEAMIKAGFKNDLSVFRGESMGVSFAYPAVWGEFEESDVRSYYVSAQFRRGSNAKIAGAYNQEPPDEHEVYWDRLAVGVELPEDLEDICSQQTKISTTCINLKTSSGIEYVRIRYDVFNDRSGFSVREAVVYIFARPGGDFPGVVIGNVELRRLGIPHSISQMDAIMESVVLGS